LNWDWISGVALTLNLIILLAASSGFLDIAILSLSINTWVKSDTLASGEGMTPFLARSASGFSIKNWSSFILLWPFIISFLISFCLSKSPWAATKSLCNWDCFASSFNFCICKSAPISASTPASATSLWTSFLFWALSKNFAVGSSNALAKLAIVLPPPVSDKPLSPPWINNCAIGSNAGYWNFFNAAVIFSEVVPSWKLFLIPVMIPPPTSPPLLNIGLLNTLLISLLIF